MCACGGGRAGPGRRWAGGESTPSEEDPKGRADARGRLCGQPGDFLGGAVKQPEGCKWGRVKGALLGAACNRAALGQGPALLTPSPAPLLPLLQHQPVSGGPGMCQQATKRYPAAPPAPSLLPSPWQQCILAGDTPPPHSRPLGAQQVRGAGGAGDRGASGCSSWWSTRAGVRPHGSCPLQVLEPSRGLAQGRGLLKCHLMAGK